MQELKKYRREALMIANDFGYPDEVIEKIKNADNETQIINVLADARRKYI